MNLKLARFTVPSWKVGFTCVFHILFRASRLEGPAILARPEVGTALNSSSTWLLTGVRCTQLLCSETATAQNPMRPGKAQKTLSPVNIATSSKFEFIGKLALEKINSETRIGSELARAFEFLFSWCPVFSGQGGEPQILQAAPARTRRVHPPLLKPGP